MTCLTVIIQALTRQLFPLTVSHFNIGHNPLVWKIIGSVHDLINGCSYRVWIYQVRMCCCALGAVVLC